MVWIPSLKLNIVVGRRRFSIGQRMVGGEEEFPYNPGRTK